MRKENLDYLNGESDDLKDRKRVTIWSKWESSIQAQVPGMVIKKEDFFYVK